MSKAVRANGLRRSRHIGAAKTHLQQVLTAAINLGRIADRIADQKPAQTRKSAFDRLVTAPYRACPFASSIDPGQSRSTRAHLFRTMAHAQIAIETLATG